MPHIAPVATMNMSVRRSSLARRLVDRVVGAYRFNDSWIYDCYLRIRYRRYYAIKQCEYAFYGRIIRAFGSGLVLDIGANHGAKAMIFSKFAERVVCFEPSPASIAVLRSRFKESRNIHIMSAGVGAEVGSLPLNIYGADGPYDTFSGKWALALSESDGSHLPKLTPERVEVVPITTLDRIIDDFGPPSYIKIDVEGFEYSVVQGLTKQVRSISIECNLPLFQAETLACLDRLARIHAQGLFNYCITEPPSGFASMVWLTKEQMAGIVSTSGLRFMEIYFVAVPEQIHFLSS